MFKQIFQFAQKLFDEMFCFAPKMFVHSFALHQKCSNKSLSLLPVKQIFALQQNMYEKSVVLCTYNV